jgi:hypothetical protein
MECALSPRRSKRTPTQAREILDYFLRNPRAADSLEGVARWRLLEGTVERCVEEVNQALGWLVDEGFLLEESPKGSAPIFCLNKERAAEAARFLDETRHPRDVVKTEKG